MAEQKLTVGIADMKMLQGEGILITYALGSCIGLCFHDPKLRLGALLHIMLPLNMEAGRTHPLKYADTGIRETLKAMEAKGASRSRMTVKIAGGAKMFEAGKYPAAGGKCGRKGGPDPAVRRGQRTGLYPVLRPERYYFLILNPNAPGGAILNRVRSVKNGGGT